jgi:D-glycero-D-manno-heptose 1,7-bisphosphate phosphatase
MARPFVFLDKDGTLLVDVPFSVDPARMMLVPGALAALRMLQRAGFGLAVVTNQSGVALGRFDEAALHVLHGALWTRLAREGIHLDGFLYCPHHPEGVLPAYAATCDCRKPAPGLLREAARVLHADLARSWMIGDILDDVEAGHRAGCRAILLDNGGETEWVSGPGREPDATAESLVEAARIIVRAHWADVASDVTTGGAA